MDMIDRLRAAFHQQFGDKEELRYFFAPGRVNLIGEHTDYNGGHVFPCALTLGTYAAGAKRSDGRVRMYSLNFEEDGVKEFDLFEIAYAESDGWANYPKGVFNQFIEAGMDIKEGFDIVYGGNIPNGAGLSSSASIELVTAVLINEWSSFGISPVDLALLSQRAENDFIGVNCGIMDQFSIALGKEDHAILLNCDTLAFEYSPFRQEGLALVIANTNKKRALADSKYNERRSECQSALNNLRKEIDIAHLCELTAEEFAQHAHLIQDETCRKRARHVVTENERTMKAVNFLKDDKMEELGALMKASHLSLKNDYEVTGLELDALAEAAWLHPGTIGSRMTGAGFGGCTISIVKEELLDSFIEETGAIYQEKTGIQASFYTAGIGGGARELTKEEM
ncbi:galactokinase [Bacillus sp. LLTC93]|nr:MULTISPECIES: galactokinase [Bacillus]MDR0124016.1 galactokinase [Bacillus zhangzhouensis]PRO42145.1 galactokinase [Bacillus sp. LLTC93]